MAVFEIVLDSSVAVLANTSESETSYVNGRIQVQDGDDFTGHSSVLATVNRDNQSASERLNALTMNNAEPSAVAAPTDAVPTVANYEDFSEPSSLAVVDLATAVTHRDDQVTVICTTVCLCSDCVCFVGYISTVMGTRQKSQHQNPKTKTRRF